MSGHKGAAFHVMMTMIRPRMKTIEALKLIHVFNGMGTS